MTMKDRILKVLMILAISAGIGWVITCIIAGLFIAGADAIAAIVLAPLAVIPVVVASAIQYVVYGEYHSLYLFRQEAD